MNSIFSGGFMARAMVSSIVLILHALCFGFEDFPTLNWSVSTANLGISYQNCIEGKRPKEIICTDSNQILIFDAETGQVVKNVTGFVKVNSIAATENGGYVIADSNRITVLSADYEKVWSRSVENGAALVISVKQLKGGGYVALVVMQGQKRLVKIINTDNNGDTVWTKTVDEKNINESSVYSATGIVEIDGTIVACGTFCPGVCLGMLGWIAAYSSEGNELWFKKRSGYTINDIKEVEDGVILTGYSEESTVFQGVELPGLVKRNWFPATQVSLLKLKADGVIVFDTGYDFDAHYCYGWRLNNVEEKNIISGYAGTYDFRAGGNHFVMASDGLGKILWNKYYPANSSGKKLPPIALPLSWGALAVMTSDSLYLYSPLSNVKKTPEFSFQVGKRMVKTRVNEIAFFLNKSSSVIVEMYNIHGKKVKKVRSESLPAGYNSIDLTGIASGQYYFQLKCGSQVPITEKIIIRE